MKNKGNEFYGVNESVSPAKKEYGKQWILQREGTENEDSSTRDTA